jgi:hypothetical protein
VIAVAPARRFNRWWLALPVLGVVVGVFYLWGTSAYSVDLAQARETVALLEQGEIVSERKCGPNSARIVGSAWRNLPSDRHRRNVALALARVCIAEGSDGRMLLFDVTTERALANFNSSTLEK